MINETDAQVLVRAKQVLITLKAAFNDLAKREMQVERDYREAKQKVQQERAELRKQCPHLDVTYHPDASGNNDSSYECKLCKAEV